MVVSCVGTTLLPEQKLHFLAESFVLLGRKQFSSVSGPSRSGLARPGWVPWTPLQRGLWLRRSESGKPCCSRGVE